MSHQAVDGDDDGYPTSGLTQTLARCPDTQNRRQDHDWNLVEEQSNALDLKLAWEAEENIHPDLDLLPAGVESTGLDLNLAVEGT